MLTISCAFCRRPFLKTAVCKITGPLDSIGASFQNFAKNVCIWSAVLQYYRVFTQSSKRPALARVFWVHLLEVCWTFAGLCKHPISFRSTV